MKKILLLTVGFSFVCVAGFAQTTPNTARVYYGEHQADIQAEKVSDDQARLNISNPNGNEKATMDIKENKQTGEISAVSRDANTGKVLSQTSGKKGEYVDSVSNIPNGNSHEIHLKKTGPNKNDLEGTVKAKGSDYEMDMQLNNGKMVGSFSQSNSKYKTKMTMFSNGTGRSEITDVKTGQVLFYATGSDDYMKVYDAQGNLIAEGNEDNPKIHDKKAYAEFERVSDYDDDED